MFHKNANAATNAGEKTPVNVSVALQLCFANAEYLLFKEH